MQITVRYEDNDTPKKYIIDRKYSGRPIFENDEEISEKMFDYADELQRLNNLQAQLTRLEK